MKMTNAQFIEEVYHNYEKGDFVRVCMTDNMETYEVSVVGIIEGKMNHPEPWLATLVVTTTGGQTKYIDHKRLKYIVKLNTNDIVKDLFNQIVEINQRLDRAEINL